MKTFLQIRIISVTKLRVIRGNVFYISYQDLMTAVIVVRLALEETYRSLLSYRTKDLVGIDPTRRSWTAGPECYQWRIEDFPGGGA